MQICSKCKKEKDASEFYLHHKTRCKECMKKYNRWWQKENPDKVKKSRKGTYARQRIYYLNWMRNKREKNRSWFIGYKKTHPCEICGQSDIRCLEFHHIDGRRKGEMLISALVHMNREKLLEEIKKCQMLCANCHAIIHYK